MYDLLLIALAEVPSVALNAPPHIRSSHVIVIVDRSAGLAHGTRIQSDEQTLGVPAAPAPTIDRAPVLELPVSVNDLERLLAE